MAGDVSCSVEDAVLPDVCVVGAAASSPVTDTLRGCTSETEVNASPTADGDDEPRALGNESTALLPDTHAEFGGVLRTTEADGGKYPGACPTPARKAGPGEFELLKVIGMGAFGKVLQVRGKQSAERLLCGTSLPSTICCLAVQ